MPPMIDCSPFAATLILRRRFAAMPAAAVTLRFHFDAADACLMPTLMLFRFFMLR